MGDYVWFHDVAWHSTYAIYFFVIGIVSGLAFISYGSWRIPPLRPLREKAAYGSFALLCAGGLLLISDLSQPLRFQHPQSGLHAFHFAPRLGGAQHCSLWPIVGPLYMDAAQEG